jgi:hypothetical protein
LLAAFLLLNIPTLTLNKGNGAGSERQQENMFDMLWDFSEDTCGKKWCQFYMFAGAVASDDALG